MRGPPFKFFEKRCCAGVRRDRLRSGTRAAEAVIDISARRCDLRRLRRRAEAGVEAGQTLTPRHRGRSQRGSRIETAFGEGALVSFATRSRAPPESAGWRSASPPTWWTWKRAAVAEVAEAHGLPFLA